MGKISTNQWKHDKKFNRRILKLSLLTRLTCLIQISCLPSNWNLDKIFALAGELDQVHMAKKLFAIFLHSKR